MRHWQWDWNFTFKAIHNLAPSYIQDLIHRHQPSRTLRSASLNLLQQPSLPRTSSYGGRAFSITAPSLWNKLPTHLRGCLCIDIFKRFWSLNVNLIELSILLDCFSDHNYNCLFIIFCTLGFLMMA